MRAFKRTWKTRPLFLLFAATLLAGVFYAISDEWHQSFVPNRESSVHDVMADGVGVF